MLEVWIRQCTWCKKIFFIWVWRGGWGVRLLPERRVPRRQSRRSVRRRQVHSAEEARLGPVFNSLACLWYYYICMFDPHSSLFHSFNLSLFISFQRGCFEIWIAPNLSVFGIDLCFDVNSCWAFFFFLFLLIVMAISLFLFELNGFVWSM